MKVPPSLIRVKIQPPHRRYPTLWLPVFLLWPIGLLLAAILLPLGFVVAVVTDHVDCFLELCRSSYSLVCEARGTLVDVEGDGAKVFIAIH
jgi:hypothetical protein